jgi:hypothetical protein
MRWKCAVDVIERPVAIELQAVHHTAIRYLPGALAGSSFLLRGLRWVCRIPALSSSASDLTSDNYYFTIFSTNDQEL